MQETLEKPPLPVEVSGEQPRRSGAAVFNLVAGWVLLAGFVAAGLGMVLEGSAPDSRYDLLKTLEADAVAGLPSTIEIVRYGTERSLEDAMRAPQEGYASVTVRWREALWHRETTYVVASSERVAQEAVDEYDRPVGVVVAPETLVEHLEKVQPALSIGEYRMDGGSRGSTEVFGVEWEFPSWAMLLGLSVGLGTLTRLVVGPQPWRLTRWAWAWPILLAWPIGVPAFLLFSGATGLLRPSALQRRVGGLVSLVLTVVVAWLISSAL